MFNFVWDGKCDKIKRDTLIARKTDGGLKMINFELQTQAIYVIMLKRMFSPGFQKWKILPQYYFGVEKYKTLAFQLNCSAIVLLKENFLFQILLTIYKKTAIFVRVKINPRQDSQRASSWVPMEWGGSGFLL